MAVAGAVAARPGLPRRVFAGLWGAYLLLGVVFTYHYVTHDYYHLPALIVVALGAGATVGRIEDAAERTSYRRAVTAGVGIFLG